MIFGIKRKINNFDPYNVSLASATNIPVLYVTGFVIQGHNLSSYTINLNTSDWPLHWTDMSGIGYIAQHCQRLEIKTLIANRHTVHTGAFAKYVSPNQMGPLDSPGGPSWPLTLLSG